MSLKASADATMSTPYSPIPRPQARAIPVRSASCRVNGPLMPAGRDGGRSQPTFAMLPRSRRANPTTPTANRTTRDDRQRRDGRPVADARHRAVAGGPGEERQRLERVDDRRQRRVAVDEVAGEEHDQPERHRARATEPWRRREGHATDRQHHHAVQGHLAEGGRDRDRVTRQRTECRADDPDRGGEQEHREDDRGDVTRELLERDRPPSLRRRGQQVEAALGGLAGERSRQGDHRPQAEQHRQRVPDAPGQEAAHRLEVDRLAEEPAEREREGRQPGDEGAGGARSSRTRARTRTARRSRS